MNLSIEGLFCGQKRFYLDLVLEATGKHIWTHSTRELSNSQSCPKIAWQPRDAGFAVMAKAAGNLARLKLREEGI